MSEISIAEAKNVLTRLIYDAERGETIHITRRGKPVAVLVSEDVYERLNAGERSKDFWQALQEWRTQESFDWLEVTPEEVESWRDRSTGREFSWDD